VRSDLAWFNNQLYSILSLICKGDALRVVKNLREEIPTRGFRAWYQLTREVASKSGVRLEKLSDRVHHPKPMKSYQDGLAALAKWKEDVRELVKIEGRELAEITKRTSLKSMLPEELQHDLEKDRSLKTFDAAWKYALEQIPIRKEWKKSTRKGKDDMDVDAAEAEEPEYEHPGAEGDDGDLNTMKGGGKGQFQGYCGYCNAWGHKRSECRKKTYDMGKGGGDPKKSWKGGKGDGGKGFGEGKGFDAGGWQQKGKRKGYGGKGQWGNGWGKGKGKGDSGPKGGGFQGAFYHIDGVGSDATWGTQNESFYNGGRFFGCLMEDFDGSDSEGDVACGLCEGEDSDDDLLMMMDDCPVPECETFAEILEAHRLRETSKLAEEVVPIMTPKRNPAVRIPKEKVRESSAEDSVGSAETSVGVSPIANVSLESVVITGGHELEQWEFIGGDDDVIEFNCDPDFEMRDVQDVATSVPGGDDQLREDIAVCLERFLSLDVELLKVLSSVCPTGSFEESVGTGLPTLMMPGKEGAINKEEARGQPPEAKPQTSAKAGRKARSRRSRLAARYNFRSGEFESVKHKQFENLSVKELKQGYVQSGKSKLSTSRASTSCTQDVVSEPRVDVPPGLEWIDLDVQNGTVDPEVNCFFNIDEHEEESKGGTDGVLNMAWKSEPEMWNNQKWKKVKSIMDSGASAPVAPPDMLPNVTVRESPGSKRGQKFSSASKHKLKNLGEQRILACTEEGEDMEILFQIADISKPLVSISSICERGNRVLFGRAGGVVINNGSGKQIPFYKENGVYVLSMWMQDADADFGRR
jgi:hypothetical protein